MNRPLPSRSPIALLRDQRGLTTVEYVIVLGLIAVVAVAAWQKFGNHVYKYLDNSDDAIGKEMKKGEGPG